MLLLCNNLNKVLNLPYNNNNNIMWQHYQGEPSQRLQIMPS